MNITGQSYISNEKAYDNSQALSFYAIDNVDQTGALTLYSNGEIVSVVPNQLSVTVGLDEFILNPHVSETITTSGKANEIFNFAPNFGTDIITGFRI